MSPPAAGIWDMARTMSGYGLGLGLLTLSGLLLNYSGLDVASTTQFDFLIILLKTYTPLLTPLSSLLGSPAIGSAQTYGILPAVIWVAVACFIGFMAQEAGSGAKAMFLAASTVVILWIASLFLSAPAWPDYMSWLTTLNYMMVGLTSRPLDILSILIIPTASSALTGGLTQLIQSRIVKRAKIEEDNYLF
ncbi:MAG: hypothetical protein N3F65_02815 [Nitrososphaeria archaeon]|nr:hypothetical protein [Aigarchaeota archaeon]MCX8187525.1 hypothetical protein [Nitrososphaeria archaeon]MDW8021065.1 hypothetical protein [Nitrososphaerota archaeon]